MNSPKKKKNEIHKKFAVKNSNKVLSVTIYKFVELITLLSHYNVSWQKFMQMTTDFNR